MLCIFIDFFIVCLVITIHVLFFWNWIISGLLLYQCIDVWLGDRELFCFMCMDVSLDLRHGILWLKNNWEVLLLWKFGVYVSFLCN
jgi:hypothetical protein